MKPELQRMLDQRVADRDALLGRLGPVVAADSRITAAWVGGSIGRNSADALSDIDLHLAVDDRHIDIVASHRRQFPALIEEPLLLMDAPQNSPPGGGFLVSLYARTAGPLQLDWNFHAHSRARIGTDTSVLWERVSVERLSVGEFRWDYQPVPAASPVEVATQSLEAFWAMLLITAKGVARQPTAAEMPNLGYVLRSLNEVREFVAGHSEPEELSATSDPAEKLRQLRDLAAQMENVVPAAARRGCAVPPKIAVAAAEYLTLIEHIVNAADR